MNLGDINFVESKGKGQYCDGMEHGQVDRLIAVPHCQQALVNELPLLRREGLFEAGVQSTASREMREGMKP